MSIKNKFEKWFYLDEEEALEKEAAVAKKQAPVQQERNFSKQPTAKNAPMPKQKRKDPQSTGTGNIVSLQSVQKASKVILVEPRVYAEAQDISEHLTNKRAVIVNLQRIDREQGIRIVDFLSGAVYALNGDIQRIGTDIFLCVPENVEVNGSISDYMNERN
ncbi:cell division protein SepF [Sporosarcina aquimarina]|uniref:Cell division protein SepF n=1 Tax=Sporosarcina aquimarina TaxID=114975 RepID=A0ABU4FYZ6_9BACL|nr:cell division protein SepF [Sporosarcina aquimarina]MDW0109300.1 cell division protein SepF [Sporosarcina aquimarina]